MHPREVVMPVNMDPAKKRRPAQADSETPVETLNAVKTPAHSPATFGTDTSLDKEKELADAEWKNLWDATEVIDMDKV